MSDCRLLVGFLHLNGCLRLYKQWWNVVELEGLLQACSKKVSDIVDYSVKEYGRITQNLLEGCL
jgi:hypothetical protein